MYFLYMQNSFSVFLLKHGRVETGNIANHDQTRPIVTLLCHPVLSFYLTIISSDLSP